jgi:hypothetical protein
MQAADRKNHTPFQLVKRLRILNIKETAKQKGFHKKEKISKEQRKDFKFMNNFFAFLFAYSAANCVFRQAPASKIQKDHRKFNKFNKFK